ncbi:hypothetical protein CQA63_08565 [Helicobacter marmotae]|uniref:Uncharacterized protein n=1 Tax=Helicobacter marmotae TaxID=152490 RepID=A0A3D8I1L2_9HELI|nr:hypothetical protein CQA63_08565 [Helicobacter marmotae]
MAYRQYIIPPPQQILGVAGKGAKQKFAHSILAISIPHICPLNGALHTTASIKHVLNHIIGAYPC